MSNIDGYKPDGDGWDWSPPDFLLGGALIFGAGPVCEFLTCRLGVKARRFVLGLIIPGAVLAICSELAVDGVSLLVTYVFG